MKKYIVLITVVLISLTTHAQVLFNETFNQYPIGALGTDVTGQTPGVGGWYIQNGFAVEYGIANKTANDNVLVFKPITNLNQGSHNIRIVSRKDLSTYYQQRITTNKVLKFSFDFYSDDFINLPRLVSTDINVYSKEYKRTLFGYEYDLVKNELVVYMEDWTKGSKKRKVLYLANGQKLKLPKNTWLTFECYLDYATSKVYYSIPALNYTVVYKIPNSYNANDSNDVPEIIQLFNDNFETSTYSLKFDNINFTMQNTVPVVTVGLNEHLAEKFNLYPNPATNVVNITNAENMQVQQVTVYDSTGKLLNTQNFTIEAAIQLNVEHLASGTYMLYLQTNEGTAVKKLVKK